MGDDRLDARTSARLFSRAQAIAGSRERLAQILGVGAERLREWMAGKGFPPQPVFEAVLELLLDAHEGRETAGRNLGERRSASSKPRVLVADTPEGWAMVREILGNELDLVHCESLTDGLDLLQGSSLAGRLPDAIVCGQHFEGSQMFYFLQSVKAYKPTRRIPFICCRTARTPLSPEVLAAARDACEALGALAYIDLTETPGRRETAAVQFRDAVRAAVRLPKNVRSLRVLVVDDNADAAHTLAVLLRMAGHEVRKAASGLEALRIADQFQPEVAVLDIAMPGMSGRVLASRLRAAPWASDLTLIALTGYRASGEAGFDYEFTKPVELARLLEAFPKPL